MSADGPLPPDLGDLLPPAPTLATWSSPTSPRPLTDEGVFTPILPTQILENSSAFVFA